jgi:hypothetical protein
MHATAHSTNSDDQAKFVVRLPESLRSYYRGLADKNRRSINQEMVIALESHAQKSDTLDILISANRALLIQSTNANITTNQSMKIVKKQGC